SRSTERRPTSLGTSVGSSTKFRQAPKFSLFRFATRPRTRTGPPGHFSERTIGCGTEVSRASLLPSSHIGHFTTDPRQAHPENLFSGRSTHAAIEMQSTEVTTTTF